MAYFDPTRGAITLRIVYDGLGTAGKTTNIRRIYEMYTLARQGEVIVPGERDGRTLYFDWLELDAGFIDEVPLRCQVLTVPGQFAYVERRWSLLRQLDALVEVCDSSPSGVTRSKYTIRSVRELLATGSCPDAPMVVQANKQDVPGALGAVELARALELDPSVRVVEAVASEGRGIQETFFYALLAARERVRARIAAEGLGALPRLTEGAAEIFQRMRAVDEAAELGAGGLVVEKLLREDAAAVRSSG